MPSTRTRALSGMWSPGTPGVVAAGMAIFACYGTLALAALLPLVGLRLALDAGIWSGTILLFTLLAVLAVVPGVRRHRSPAPALAAVAGAGLVAFALLVAYHVITELSGFIMLAGAAWRDALLHRKQRLESLDGAAS